jgi:DnaK suppressor protein
MVRLEAGEIDECEECSEPIGFKRLLARPVTTLCFECKTAREQTEADEPVG